MKSKAGVSLVMILGFNLCSSLGMGFVPKAFAEQADNIQSDYQNQKAFRVQESFNKRRAVVRVQDAYREMLAAFKAKRNVYAQDRSEELKVLLDSHYLHEGFRRKMKRKHEEVLAKFHRHEETAFREALIKPEKVIQSKSEEIRLKKEALELDKGFVLAQEKRLAQESWPAQNKEKRKQDQERELRKVRQQKADLSRLEQDVARADERKLSVLSDDEKKALIELDWAKKRVEALRKEIKKDRQEAQKKLDEQILEIYRKAINLYQQEEYHQAYAKFRDVERMRPDYELTRDYLAIIKAEADLGLIQRKNMAEKKQALIDQVLDEVERSLVRFK